MHTDVIFLPFLQAYRFDRESDRVSFGLHVHKAVKHGCLRNSIQLVEILLFSICPFWICKGGLPAHGLTTVVREARWVARHQGFNAEQRLLWQQVGGERKVQALHKGTNACSFQISCGNTLQRAHAVVQLYKLFYKQVKLKLRVTKRQKHKEHTHSSTKDDYT